MKRRLTPQERHEELYRLVSEARKLQAQQRIAFLERECGAGISLCEEAKLIMKQVPTDEDLDLMGPAEEGSDSQEGRAQQIADAVGPARRHGILEIGGVARADLAQKPDVLSNLSDVPDTAYPREQTLNTFALPLPAVPPEPPFRCRW